MDSELILAYFTRFSFSIDISIKSILHNIKVQLLRNEKVNKIAFSLITFSMKTRLS